MENITDEMMAAYLDGNATESERAFIESHQEDFAADMVDIRASADMEFPVDFGFNWVYNPVLQLYSDTCAIKSQQLILNEFGVPCSESELIDFSVEKGWYDGHGTRIEDVGNLLEQAGIQCTRTFDANIFNIMNELARGHKVIVGVDSGELVGNRFHEWMEDFFVGESPDHALLVTGIDTSDPDNIKVIVTDPGTGEIGRAYPVEQFMEAWADSDFFMCSTDIPAPPTAPGMENFDYLTGHLATVAGMDFAQFQMFNDLSMGLPVAYPEADTYHYPMADLMEAYFDVAANEALFADIFHDYDFNDYLDTDIVNGHLTASFDHGMDVLHLDPSLTWDTYAADNAIFGEFTNEDYSNYLSHTIDALYEAGDFQNAAILDQQHHMMDYCNSQNINFHDTFYC